MEALLGFYNESNKPIEVSFNINKINLCYIIKPMEFKYAIGDFYPIPVYHHEHIKTELKKIYTTLPKEGHWCYYNTKDIIWFHGALTGTITLFTKRDYLPNLIVKRHLDFLNELMELPKELNLKNEKC